MSEKISKKQARTLLWINGSLIWKLDAVQKELYNVYKNSSHKTTVWSCSRRIGKSYCLCVIAIERCLQKPDSIVKFIAPTQKHVRSIIRPLLKEILEDCPPDLRPEFRVAENIYRFPNGSEIQLAGTDQGHAEGLRGGSSDLCIVDEAGFCDDLRYIVQSILIPTTTTTRGKIILSSTPPVSPDHEFCRYMEEAEYRGNFVKKTVYDGIGSRLTAEMVKEIVDELGGEDSSDFRREYLCEVIVAEERSIVPEFNKDIQELTIKEWKRPSHFDGYVGGDIGFKDLTVFLFAYYDFREAKLIIEDELVMSGRSMTTDALAASIRGKEAFLWTNELSKEVKPPYLRVCDNNLIVINDLINLHDLDVIPTAKDDSQQAINNLRIMIKEGRIIIHPRCVTLIRHLKNGTWNKQHRSFNRSPDDGHYDAIDALKYLVRNVQYSKNPYPSNYMQSGDLWFIPDKEPGENTVSKVFNKIFKPRRSLTK